MGQIGIGILSTNRPRCLKRLIESIEKFTKNLNTIDVFVSDDSNNAEEFGQIDDYISQRGFISFKHVGERIGVAKNTNRVLYELRNHRYKILLNNDVEVLKQEWETFYFEAMQKSGFHAFCFRQLGLWGACKEGETGKNNVRPDKRIRVGGVEIATIQEKPHGAILPLDEVAFEAVGYFDERFGAYGMEHHDYYFRISESGIQPKGIHDVGNSNLYFRVHNDNSCLDWTTKTSSYQKSKELYAAKIAEAKKEIYIGYKK